MQYVCGCVVDGIQLKISQCEEDNLEALGEFIATATNQKTTSDPKSSSVQRHRALTIFQNHHLARSTATSHCYRKRDNNVQGSFQYLNRTSCASRWFATGNIHQLSKPPEPDRSISLIKCLVFLTHRTVTCCHRHGSADPSKVLQP